MKMAFETDTVQIQATDTVRPELVEGHSAWNHGLRQAQPERVGIDPVPRKTPGGWESTQLLEKRWAIPFALSLSKGVLHGIKGFRQAQPEWSIPSMAGNGPYEQY
jgi:hypothetical protein